MTHFKKLNHQTIDKKSIVYDFCTRFKIESSQRKQIAAVNQQTKFERGKAKKKYNKE